MKKILPYLTIIGFYLCVWLLGWIIIRLHFESSISSLLDQHLQQRERIYTSVLNSVRTITSFYFESVLSTEQFLEILSLPDENLRREKIYEFLFPLNMRLKEKFRNIEIHIHTEEGKSLLRLYEPTKFGDDLTQVREDVKHVVNYKTPVFGFATGRVLSGLRYTFPIFSYDRRYLGSADVSLPLDHFETLLVQADRDTLYRFILKEERVLPKLDPRYQTMFRVIRKNWIELNTPIIEEKVKPQFLDFLYADPSFVDALEKKVSQVKKYKFNSSYYIVVLIPVKNFKDEVEGYALGITSSPQLPLLYATFSFYKISFSLFVIILCVFSLSLYKFFKRINLERKKFSVIINFMGNGLYVIKNDRIILANQKMSEILKFTPEELIGRSDHEVFVETKESCPICESIKKERNFEGDLLFKRKDGTFLFVNVKVSHLKTDEGVLETIVLFSDITLRKKLEEQLHIEAMTDPLTQLFNRRFLSSVLESLTETVKERKKSLSLIMADIDNFKHINDTYGHEMGDEVLKELAKLLKGNLRDEDIVGRWGGEEFLIILVNTGLEDAIKVAEKIRKKISESLILGKLNITVSFGVSEYKMNEDIKEAIKRVDEALYEAKLAGKNCVRFKK